MTDDSNVPPPRVPGRSDPSSTADGASDATCGRPDDLPSDLARRLPHLLEVKHTLAGREKRFECRVLRHEGPHLVVLFVSPSPMHVHGVDLPAGTITFGHFWTDRPYNVYHWLDATRGSTIGMYLNLSTDTRIANHPGPRLDWLDLVVDILVMPDGRVTVLDENEIPADAAAVVRSQIAEAKAAALRDVPALVRELESERAALWPALAPKS